MCRLSGFIRIRFGAFGERFGVGLAVVRVTSWSVSSWREACGSAVLLTAPAREVYRSLFHIQLYLTSKDPNICIEN